MDVNAPCIYTDMKWAMKLWKAFSSLLQCWCTEDLGQYRTRDTVCLPSTKDVPFSFFPQLHRVYLHSCCCWQCHGWWVCLTAREMKSPFRVTQKSPWRSWIALDLLTDACATIKCGFFSAGDNLCLVLGVFVLTIALSRQGAEQLAGREEWGLGKLGSKLLNPGVSFWTNAMEKVNWAQQNIRLNSLVIKNNNSCSLKKNAGDV